MKAVELINKSWYLSGIVARGQETVPGDYVEVGLDLLNALLSFASTDLARIPYFKEYPLTLTQGEELYFIENLYEIETFTFNIGPVRFPTTNLNRTQYFGTGRVDNVESLPFSWHLERTKGGSNLRLYFVPNSDYPATIVGKFALDEVTLYQDLSTVYDDFYQEYLRYALAGMMCEEWDVEFSAAKAAKLAQYIKKLQYVSPPDLTIQKTAMMTNNKTLNWALVNIPGYVP